MEENILIIPDGTIKIEAESYKGQPYTHIEFPPSLREIGESAFEGCEQITYLKFPSGLTKIGTRAFYACTSLGEVFIPESVMEIGEEAFSEFGLIYCETSNPFSKRWFDECSELECDSGNNAGAAEEKTYCINVRTWCGNYQYQSSSDGYFIHNKDMLLDPMRKCLFGRKEKYIHILQGVFYYDLPKHLLDMGEDNLRRGFVPNMNSVMKRLQESIKETMEDRVLSAEDILSWIVFYVEAVAEPFSDFQHNEEGAFIIWGIAQYVWQLIQISDRCGEYHGAETMLLRQRREMHSLLVSFDDRWENILNLLEQVDLKGAKITNKLKRYAKAAYDLQPQAVYNLGLLLKDEGNEKLGITLMNASEDVEDDITIQEYVKNVANVIIDGLGKISH